ncbi:tetraacyldisaccharide 4'-kinase [Flavobacteriaceae bacterium S0825]|uniref:tetraacyldisaccharide 4'-kinase n=1 Tax=Gaetbulibacter sp. S0825 TaxID=2720084 RepID=UPI0014302BC1|nr:tetraacyldisaccharide 4'-kinase [Flavobacteriaceae bacterium S0825]NIX65967.1 tetraacyldisaccharide 4'-kinase [Gaetbulibacter sp. S0825]
MKLLRNILLPIVPIYYGVTWLRNVLYDKGVFKSKSYDFPVICVGNLSVGGTGKTPMIEYLIRLLKDNYKLATLSRGYKRSTDGFQIANDMSSAETIGDEPYQFYSKFKGITVSVDANRQHGISKLQSLKNPDVILLDDAFQHRKVDAGFNILLTTYDKLYIDDITLPTGDLREPKSGAKRANVIVVTKCPKDITIEERSKLKHRLQPKSHQEVFFSTIDYSSTIYSNSDNVNLSGLKDENFTLVTGIANAIPLVNFLNDEGYNFEHINFKDHHIFTDADIEALNEKEIIVTTEKDFTKLGNKLIENKLYYLPIETKIFEHEKFNKILLAFCTKY